VIAPVGECSGFLEYPELSDADLSSQNGASSTLRVEFVSLNEVAAGLAQSGCHAVQQEQGQLDSSWGAGVDEAAAVADGSVWFDPNVTVEFVAVQLVVTLPDPGSSGVRKRLAPFPRDHTQGVEQPMSESFDVVLNSHRMVEGRANAVAELGTFDDHFEDNAELFSVVLAAGARTA
jgi:hypothetical protein